MNNKDILPGYFLKAPLKASSLEDYSNPQMIVGDFLVLLDKALHKSSIKSIGWTIKENVFILHLQQDCNNRKKADISLPLGRAEKLEFAVLQEDSKYTIFLQKIDKTAAEIFDQARYLEAIEFIEAVRFIIKQG